MTGLASARRKGEFCGLPLGCVYSTGDSNLFFLSVAVRAFSPYLYSGHGVELHA